MYTKTALILMIIILSLYPATGDVPVDGIVQYPYQYLITNAGSFPEFTFLTSSENWGFDHPALVINGSFGGGYNQDGFILHAIASTTLDETIRARLSGSNQPETNFSEYFSHAPLATADILLPVSTGMDETIPVQNITILLEVADISGAVMQVTKTSTILQFTNGTSMEEKNEQVSPDLLSASEELDLLHLV